MRAFYCDEFDSLCKIEYYLHREFCFMEDKLMSA